MAAHLEADRYGKSGIRLATVRRDGDRHHFTDLTIEARLEGAFEAVHVEGDNAAVLPTDTMRATCYALARERGVDGPEAFGIAVAERLLEACPAATSAWLGLEAHPWERLRVDGREHPHAFRAGATGARTATVTLARGEPPARVTAGVRGLRLLKTTGSAFAGFLTDAYTVLAETSDRVMATTVEAEWRYSAGAVDHDRLAAEVPETFSAAFATHDDSRSVQHTLYAMGSAVIAAHPEVDRIRFRLPNEHHVLADLEPFGLDNPGEVFVVTDRPFGVIEGTVARGGAARA